MTNIYRIKYHRTLLVRWSLYKYKCLWDVRARVGVQVFYLIFKKKKNSYHFEILLATDYFPQIAAYVL